MLIGNCGIKIRIMNQESRIKKKTITYSAQETEGLGQKIAKRLKGGEILALNGNLGGGKTTFLKGLAKELGVKQIITSPTFVLMKVYSVKQGYIRQFVHVDCYRIPGTELSKIGLNDYLGDPYTIVAIEWADKLKIKGKKIININFQHGKSEDERIISWSKN
jgi:tRNA threonylcarbamoyladenosine biosynthesis protein TsaE